MKNQIITVQGSGIAVITKHEDDYLSITDIARHKNPEEPKDIVKNWMRSKTTIEFLGLWERLHNPNFKGVEFDSFMYQAGTNAFVLSPSKWIESTNAIGIISKPGNNGGTFAHRDIAFEFASWISAEFKLYLLLEFQRLKKTENQSLKLEWNLQRTLAKINYRIHTDAIKEKIIPVPVTRMQANAIYASEADLLNVALFGQTAKEWRENNPGRGTQSPVQQVGSWLFFGACERIYNALPSVFRQIIEFPKKRYLNALRISLLFSPETMEVQQD